MSHASPATPPAPPAPRAQVLAGWKKCAAILAGLAIRAWCATLRITLTPESRALLGRHPEPTLFVLWHNRLFIAATLSRRYRDNRRIHALISASKDGAWLSAFFESVGLRAVRGSSSRGGREAAADLVRLLGEGHDAGITPDGPRGPIYTCKPGALVVARRAGVRVILLGVAYESAWRLRSWDRFLLPRPFSRVRLTLRTMSPTALAENDALARLENTLRDLNPAD